MERKEYLRNNPVFWSRLGFCYDPPLKNEQGKPLVFTENFEKYISNISNAKNLQLFSTPGGEEIIYILTEDGKVYNYALSNIDKNNFEATIIDDYNNIEKMMIYKTRKANAGGCDYLILIDNDNKYYTLDSYCV